MIIPTTAGSITIIKNTVSQPNLFSLIRTYTINGVKSTGGLNAMKRSKV